MRKSDRWLLSQAGHGISRRDQRADAGFALSCTGGKAISPFVGADAAQISTMRPDRTSLVCAEDLPAVQLTASTQQALQQPHCV
jgi:hypothetical protein